jgi:hypothetical protein
MTGGKVKRPVTAPAFCFPSYLFFDYFLMGTPHDQNLD